MKLTDLGAQFLQYEVRDVDPTKFVDGIQSPSGKRVSLPHVDTLEQAHGILFACPKCVGSKHPHQVICWFVGKVPDTASPGPGRWTPSGTGLADLTFVPGKPARAVSVLLNGGCGWHGFVRNGDAK